MNTSSGGTTGWRLYPQRPVERIQRVLLLIETIWRQNPDWRLGQLLTNAVGMEFEANSFNFEDVRLETALRDFLERSGQPVTVKDS